MAATATEGKAHPLTPIAAEKPMYKEKLESAEGLATKKIKKNIHDFFDFLWLFDFSWFFVIFWFFNHFLEFFMIHLFHFHFIVKFFKFSIVIMFYVIDWCFVLFYSISFLNLEVLYISNS